MRVEISKTTNTWLLESTQHSVLGGLPTHDRNSEPCTTTNDTANTTAKRLATGAWMEEHRKVMNLTNHFADLVKHEALAGDSDGNELHT